MNKEYLEYLSLKSFYKTITSCKGKFEYCGHNFQTYNGDNYNLDKIKERLEFLERDLFDNYRNIRANANSIED